MTGALVSLAIAAWLCVLWLCLIFWGLGRIASLLERLTKIAEGFDSQRGAGPY